MLVAKVMTRGAECSHFLVARDGCLFWPCPLAKGVVVMATSGEGEAEPVEPVVLPDVATQAHPAGSAGEEQIQQVGGSGKVSKVASTEEEGEP